MSIATRRLHPLALLLLAGLPAGSSSTALVRGEIAFEERTWNVGSIPSLTFTVTAGRTNPNKVACYLYFSEDPNPFEDPFHQRVFVGVISVPGSLQVPAFPPLERGPEITEFTREKFVQGAMFSTKILKLEGVTNVEYLDIEYEADAEIFALDFETEDDFETPLANGQDLSTAPEFGRLFSISSLQPSTGDEHFGPAIFDTDQSGPNLQSADPDLLVDLGNAVILQQNEVQTVSGIFNRPDDAADGGSIVFEFTGFDVIEKVEPLSIDLLDIDGVTGTGVTLTLTDTLGRVRMFSVPNGWTEDILEDEGLGYRTLDLTTLLPQPGFLGSASAEEDPTFVPGEVERMEITLHGSGAIDNLVFAREADPSGAEQD